MALIFEFLAQQWIQVAALLALVVMLILHEARKSGPSLSPQQAINLINAEEGVFLDLRDTSEFKKGHIPRVIETMAFEKKNAAPPKVGRYELRYVFIGDCQTEEDFLKAVGDV